MALTFQQGRQVLTAEIQGGCVLVGVNAQQLVRQFPVQVEGNAARWVIQHSQGRYGTGVQPQQGFQVFGRAKG